MRQATAGGVADCVEAVEVIAGNIARTSVLVSHISINLLLPRVLFIIIIIRLAFVPAVIKVMTGARLLTWGASPAGDYCSSRCTIDAAGRTFLEQGGHFEARMALAF